MIQEKYIVFFTTVCEDSWLQVVYNSTNYFVNVDSFIKECYNDTKFIHLKKTLSMLWCEIHLWILFVADLISRINRQCIFIMTNGYPEPAISRLDESTVKAESLISIGRSLMETELNTRLEFQPCDVTRMNWQHTKVHYMRRIWSIDNVEKLTTTAFPFYQNRLWNSCLLKSCLRQQVRGKEKCFSTNSVNALLCLLY